MEKTYYKPEDLKKFGDITQWNEDWIGFTGIGAIVDDCLQNAPDGDVRSLEAVLEIDARTRLLAETRCESYMSGASMAKTRGGV